MMLRLLTSALLIVGSSDALLRGRNHDNYPDEMRRDLEVTGCSEVGDPCDAKSIEQDLANFGFTGEELQTLVEAAVYNCLEQLNPMLRTYDCLCYDEAVAISKINSHTHGNSRHLEAHQTERRLSVITPGQHCTSNSDCSDPLESCMVGPHTWVCSTEDCFLGAIPLCDEEDTVCMTIVP